MVWNPTGNPKLLHPQGLAVPEVEKHQVAMQNPQEIYESHVMDGYLPFVLLDISTTCHVSHIQLI